MDVDSFISYWRDCLADSELRSPRVDGGWEISEDTLRSGKLDGTLVEKIFDAAGKRQGRIGRGRRTSESEELTEVVLFICPYGLRRKKVHGQARQGDKNSYTPFWIAAKLYRDGALQGDPDLGAWFVREFLAPVGGGQPVIGEIEAYDAFLTCNAPPVDGEWQEHRKFARQLHDAVVGPDSSCFDAQGLVEVRGRVVLGEAKRGSGVRILQLYDAVLRDKPALPLLQAAVRGSRPLSAPCAFPDDDDSAPTSEAVSDRSLRHGGQMCKDFSLSPSQRQAMHSLEMTPAGGMLAVNGPPGTGKTSLLESVVASLWVNAALAGGEPPVILACAASNQAITNILDRFAGTQSSGDGDPMTVRWLPRLKSYGLYLPSKGRFASTVYAAARPVGATWGGLPERMENEEYLNEARAFYLERARASVDLDTVRVEDVVKRLEGEMRDARHRLEALLKMAADLGTYRRQSGVEGAAKAKKYVQENCANASQKIERLKTAHFKVQAALAGVPFYEDLLAWLPAVRHRIELRLNQAFSQMGVEGPERFGKDRLSSINRHFAKLLEPIQGEHDDVRRWLETENDFAACIAGLIKDEKGRGDILDVPGRVEGLLDVTLRHRLFNLAGRYWEGRWLLELDSLLSRGSGLFRRKREACEARWRRFAKLTPCLVSTFHTAPGLFDHYDPANGGDGNPNRPLYSFIDLLIIEEAGQTSPEIGAAMLALARRALVVGDVHQIEPVWNVQEAVDDANLRAQDLNPDTRDLAAFRASSGSMMRLGQRATAVSGGKGDPGILLTEHRRSVPEVIDFCNDLVYRGLLQPVRKPLSQRILPPMGWAQIRSRTERQGSSWVNRGEAGAIAGWLSGMRKELEQHYGQHIAEIVGVITPFAAQKDVLKQALVEQDLANVDAGTVHTFQGAERPVIVFSPVYSHGDTESYFFDRGPNMLNVAASRAADSFLVIGDMRLFDHKNRVLPSGLLARRLFAARENEIFGVEAWPELDGFTGLTRFPFSVKKRPSSWKKHM